MRRRREYRDRSNEVFGRLKVLFRGENIGKDCAWQCECACGNFCLVRTGCLISGATKSCGCLRREIAVEKIETGTCDRIVSHGCAGRAKQSAEYIAWVNAKGRYPGTLPDFTTFDRMVGPKPEGHRLIHKPDGFVWSPTRRQAAHQTES